MTCRGRFLRARSVLIVCAAAALAASAPASAEDVPAPPLPGMSPLAAPASGTNRIVVMPSERSADIQAHWAARREHVRDRDERRADDEEQRVRTLREDLAIENLFSVGSALVRESQAALAAGAPALALQRCKLAVEVAPALVAAHTCLARALMADSIIAVKPAVLALVAAGTAATSDPRASRAALANLLSMLFVGLLVTTLGFAVVVFLRYANLYTHDVHHLFPGGVRGWQTRMLAALLLLLPVLLQMGPVPLLFSTMLAFALYASTAEVAISIFLLGCLAASPFAAEQIG
ncbi:MAG TPA: hypothetical protein VIH51_04355, partial [Myxococcales bacterium]